MDLADTTLHLAWGRTVPFDLSCQPAGGMMPQSLLVLFPE